MKPSSSLPTVVASSSVTLAPVNVADKARN
jgi:hypothetical protein